MILTDDDLQKIFYDVFYISSNDIDNLIYKIENNISFDFSDYILIKRIRFINFLLESDNI